MGVAAGVPEALVAFETGEALGARSLVAAEHRLAAALVGFGSSDPWGLDGRALLSVASDLRGHITHTVALAERTGNVGRALARADERDTVNDRAAAAYIAAATGRLSPGAAAEYARTGDLAPATAYIEAGRAALRADQLAHLEALAAGLLLFAQSAQSVADAASLVGNITSLVKLAGSTVLHRIAARRGAEAAARLLESAGTLPAGFVSADDFIAFSDSARMGLVRAGYEDATAILQGSAVTGRSFRTSEAFDVGRLSDFDLAIASPTALQRATALGMPLRSGGVRTGPLDSSQLEELGLKELADSLSAEAGRPVKFMLYESIDTAVARAPSIILP